MAAAQNVAGFLIISSAELNPGTDERNGDHENVDVVQVENCPLSDFVVQVHKLIFLVCGILLVSF